MWPLLQCRCNSTDSWWQVFLTRQFIFYRCLNCWRLVAHSAEQMKPNVMYTIQVQATGASMNDG